MSYKTFSTILLAVIPAYLIVVLVINIIVDPFYIFQTPFFKEQAQINDRYAKIQFLKENNQRFNSYMMGSSRMFLTYPEVIEKYIPGTKFYNLATIFGTMHEHLLHIKYFLDNGYPVKNLYIGLDMDMYAIAALHNQNDFLLRLHPHVLKKDPIAFYWSYMNTLPRRDLLRKLRVNFKKRASSKYQIDKDGTLALRSEGKNPQVFFERPLSSEKLKIKNEKMVENLNALKELVELCNKHHINLILFTTPYHKELMDRFMEEDYMTLLRDLSEVSPYWDFSGYNSVTTDNKNYLDHSHYKPSVSRLIAARIFSDQTFNVPEDFGILVTKENVGLHVERIKSGFKTMGQIPGTQYLR